MTIERREEHTEVMSSNASDAGPVDGSASGQVRTTAHQTATFAGDPYAARRRQVVKIQQGVYLLFGILEGLLGIRFVLGLLGANPAAGFAQFIYSITGPFIAPFVGLFGQPHIQGNVVEWNALVAIIVYALLAWVLVKVVWLVLGDTRRGQYTSTSSHTDTA